MAAGLIGARRSIVVSSVWLCCCCLALAFGAERAAADPGPEFTVPNEIATEPAAPAFAECPEALPPEPLESEDAAAVQVFELRREAQRACVATTERLRELIARQWWIVSQLLGEQAEAKLRREYLERGEVEEVQRRELLTEIRNEFVPGPLEATLAGVDAENPLPVSGLGGEASPEETAELVAAIDASGEGTTTALWMVAGLLVALFIGAALQRTVDRGT